MEDKYIIQKRSYRIVFFSVLTFLGGVIATLATLFCIVWYGFFAMPMPWKITNPSHPRFNAEKFNLTDYPSSRELGAAVRVLFPAGTDKEVVDRAMTKAGARIRVRIPRPAQEKSLRLFYYEQQNLRSLLGDWILMTPAGDSAWRVGIYYDDRDKITRVVAISP